nr:hypothetical protein [Thermostichus vulcanus]
MQVYPFTGSIGGNQDPQRIFVGIPVEGSFAQLATFVTHAAMKSTDALILLVIAAPTRVT